MSQKIPAVRFSTELVRRAHCPEGSVIVLSALIFQMTGSPMIANETYGVLFVVTAEFPSQRNFSLSREIFGYEKTDDSPDGRFPAYKRSEAITHAEIGFGIGREQVEAQHMGYLKQALHKLTETLDGEGHEKD